MPSLMLKLAAKQLNTASHGWRSARMIRASGKSRRMIGTMVHRQRVLVDQELAGRERSCGARQLEIFVSRGADLIIAGGRKLLERLQSLRGLEKGRLLLEHLDVGMPHQHRVEQRRSRAREADEEDRRWAFVPCRFVAPALHPCRVDRCQLHPEAFAIRRLRLPPAASNRRPEARSFA